MKLDGTTTTEAEAAPAVVPFFGGQCKIMPTKNLFAKVSKVVCNFASLTPNLGKVASFAGITRYLPFIYYVSTLFFFGGGGWS
jgi:hypothetical protein